MDEFVADNTYMNDVDFEDVSVGHGKHFGQQQNCQFIGETFGDNLGQKDNYRYQDHNAELGGDFGTVKLKIPAFSGKNDP